MRWNVRDNLTLHCTLELNQLTLGQALEPMHIYVIICSAIACSNGRIVTKMQNAKSLSVTLSVSVYTLPRLFYLDLSSSLYQSKLYAGFIV